MNKIKIEYSLPPYNLILLTSYNLITNYQLTHEGIQPGLQEQPTTVPGAQEHLSHHVTRCESKY